MTRTSSTPDRAGCETGDQEGRMSITEAQTIKRFYENELNGYAYLEVEQAPKRVKGWNFRVANNISWRSSAS